MVSAPQKPTAISPLTAARSELSATTTKLGPKKGGGTGLYDTVLAAYREVQRDYVPGRINSVILFTDGKNENKDGISRAQLLSELKRLADPKRPVRLVIIGIGNEVDRQELEAITTATKEQLCIHHVLVSVDEIEKA